MSSPTPTDPKTATLTADAVHALADVIRSCAGHDRAQGTLTAACEALDAIADRRAEVLAVTRTPGQTIDPTTGQPAVRTSVLVAWSDTTDHPQAGSTSTIVPPLL